jgi:hypothetical protein
LVSRFFSPPLKIKVNNALLSSTTL